MKYSVYDRLFQREIGQHGKKYADIRSIYGDPRWVESMDIVDELQGHHGCVNALSWSSSGRLLASGSDDERINIHSYQPESSTSQFSLATSIQTGHRCNIFSVKFMPKTNDRTMVSAADDVRIFDLEHSGHLTFGSSRNRSNTARHSMGIMRDGITLTEGDTNAKAFRCHTDTVKRIITEDNPFYFLTCSNDGDIRQWDVRQPSSAYLPAKDTMAPLWARDEDASDNIPPPLISYSRYALDLNTASCSPSRPHYIALGGAHLHCFLHDRRMLGRDKNRERGSRLSSPANWGNHDDDLLGQATQCVKKFAPHGKQRMKRNDTGHITGCKISDADPNELVVSWSQDHIYSFDILRTPDVSEELVPSKVINGNSRHRVKGQDRKRKRKQAGLSLQEAAQRGGSRQRTESSESDLALRVTYGNGQSEEIRIEPPDGRPIAREEFQDRTTNHYRIARASVKISSDIYNLAEHGEAGLSLAVTSILGLSHSILPEMDDIDRTWEYPVGPEPVDIAVQENLRARRAASRRFVQAAGTVARALGGQLLTGANSDALISRYFASIQPAPRERDRDISRHEQFGYDFLKAILLWVDSGPGAVVEGFSSRRHNPRHPIPHESDIDAIDEYLVPYLLELASDKPVVNVDFCPFTRNTNHLLFLSENEAVMDFAQAVKIPFADLVETTASDDQVTPEPVQCRQDAKRKWAFTIGRSILRRAAKDIKFDFVDCAYGGREKSDKDPKNEDKAQREQGENKDAETNGDGGLNDGSVTTMDAGIVASSSRSPVTSGEPAGIATEDEDDDDELDDDEDEDEDDEDDDEGTDNEDDFEEDDDSDEEEEGEYGLRRTRSGRTLWRSDFARSQYRREKAEMEVPCAPHTRVYTGHCNSRTVKEVDFFGLQDEYVVSGSDCGSVFVWDRNTGWLANILEGDGEVVNVVQGHPYEPTMAVSGIDNTIKIFSPDIRLQRNARKGIGVHSVDPSTFASLNWGRRRRVQSPAVSRKEPSVDSEALSESDDEPAVHGLRSRKRMHEAYEITSQNDMDRKGDRDDYFISQAVFTQLARHVAARRGGEGEGEGEEGPIVISDENCATM